MTGRKKSRTCLEDSDDLESHEIEKIAQPVSNSPVESSAQRVSQL